MPDRKVACLSTHTSQHAEGDVVSDFNYFILKTVRDNVY